jgi:DNA polymerase III sliding clamp (beta) subunit (PCNA family)
MRVTVPAAAIRSALSRGATGSGAGIKLPIVGFARIAADGESITVETTDFEATARVTVPAKVHTPGELCIKADLLAAACGVDTDVTIDDGTVSRGRSKLRVPTANPGEFPSLEDLQFAGVDLDPMQLAHAIDVVSYAMASNHSLHFLNGIIVDRGYVAASDGHRLAMVDVGYGGATIVLPRAQVQRIRKLLAPDARFALANVDGGRAGLLCIESGDTRFVVRLIAAAPPDMRTQMPKRMASSAQVRTKPLVAALERFTPFAMVKLGDKAESRPMGRVSMGPDASHLSDRAEQRADDTSPTRCRVSTPNTPSSRWPKTGSASPSHRPANGRATRCISSARQHSRSLAP